jgi:hypothetical protein
MGGFRPLCCPDPMLAQTLAASTRLPLLWDGPLERAESIEQACAHPSRLVHDVPVRFFDTRS